jgi:radical SAM protein with 4Fe4S-binding SPASM domain
MTSNFSFAENEAFDSLLVDERIYRNLNVSKSKIFSQVKIRKKTVIMMEKVVSKRLVASSPKEATELYSINIFLGLFENPLLRSFIRFLYNHHFNNVKSYLEAALEDIAGVGEKRFSPIRLIFSGIIKAAVHLGCIGLDIDEEYIRETLKLSYFRSGIVNVLSGVGIYGVTKPYRVPAPFLVVWNYTNACNLRCKHCYQRADKPTLDELTLEEKLAVIDQLVENNVSIVAFSGGEPLLCEDFFKVAKYAYERGLYVSVATNGTLLTKENVARLKATGVAYVEISLDGATAEIHDSFRGVSGCFEKTRMGIANSVEAGMFTCIATTTTKHNLNEIPKIISLAKEIGVRRVIIFNFIPTGRGEEIAHLDLTPAERESLLKYLYRELASGKVEVLSTAPQFSRVCLQQSLIEGTDILSPTHFVALNLHGKAKRLTDFLGGCGAGRLYCAIQPNGLVTPCVFMPIVVGDLRRQSLKDIWLNSQVMNDLRDRSRLKGRCGYCEYKYVCGGCRARAYAYYKDYLASDPGCIYNISPI